MQRTTGLNGKTSGAGHLLGGRRDTRPAGGGAAVVSPGSAADQRGVWAGRARREEKSEAEKCREGEKEREQRLLLLPLLFVLAVTFSLPLLSLRRTCGDTAQCTAPAAYACWRWRLAPSAVAHLSLVASLDSPSLALFFFARALLSAAVPAFCAHTLLNQGRTVRDVRGVTAFELCLAPCCVCLCT